MPTDYSSLDFLARASVVLLNAKPNEEGQVTVDREQLDGKSVVCVMVVDPWFTSRRTVLLPPAETKTLDLRLLKGQSLERPFSQQKQITLLQKGQDFEVDDIRTAKFELYDSLARVYQLFETLQPHPHLDEFLDAWPEPADG